MFVDIIYWLFFMTLWAYVIKYRKVIKWWTWNFVWAEQYLWRWWTYFVILLFWLWMIFYWVIYPLWWFSSVLDKDAQEERERERDSIEVKRELNNKVNN